MGGRAKHRVKERAEGEVGQVTKECCGQKGWHVESLREAGRSLARLQEPKEVPCDWGVWGYTGWGGMQRKGRLGGRARY